MIGRTINEIRGDGRGKEYQGKNVPKGKGEHFEMWKL